MKSALLKSLVAVSVVAFLFGASATANAFDDPFAERGTEYFYGEGASEHAAERAANDAASEWFTNNPHCEREKTAIIYNKWDSRLKAYVCKIQVDYIWHQPPTP